ncbi:MAG: MarR family transcriptional regulator [Burkholderiaceae bacterium]|nr:MarR family transcriptional regulator [Burkholderiaceae bacterium]
MSAFYDPDDYRLEESVGYMMRRILAVFTQTLSARLCEHDGPTYPQWMPLYKLHMRQAVTVVELARECSLDTGAMTRLLDRLEAKGLCRRVRSVADRRVVNIELTDEGRAAAQEVPRMACQVQNEYLAGFSRQEWELLKGFLSRILSNAQAHSAHGENRNESTSHPAE